VVCIIKININTIYGLVFLLTDCCFDGHDSTINNTQHDVNTKDRKKLLRHWFPTCGVRPPGGTSLLGKASDILGNLYIETKLVKILKLLLKKLRGFVRERTISTERLPLVGEVVPTFADRGCCVVSATDSHGR
jgi:hypothetical protein